MNNVTFGDSQLSYYETVAGGSGAVCNKIFIHILVKDHGFNIFDVCHKLPINEGCLLGRTWRCSYTYDEHENHRCGDSGTPVCCANYCCTSVYCSYIYYTLTIRI